MLFLFAGFLVSIEVFREIRIPFTGIRLGGTRRERRGMTPAMRADAPAVARGPAHPR